MQVFQIQCRGVKILEESPLSIEQVVVTRPPTSPQVRSPSKLFSLLSTPPRQGIVAHNSSQRMGSPIGSNSASTSTAVATPHEIAAGNPSAKRNTRKGGN